MVTETALDLRAVNFGLGSPIDTLTPGQLHNFLGVCDPVSFFNATIANPNTSIVAACHRTCLYLCYRPNSAI